MLNITSLNDITYKDPTTGAVYSYNSDGTATYQPMAGKNVPAAGPVSGTAFLDGLKSQIVTLTVTGNSANSAFPGVTPTDKFALKGSSVTVLPTAVSGWYTTQSSVKAAYSANASIPFTYVKGATLSGKTAVASPTSALFTGANASVLMANNKPVITITWSDNHTETVQLTDPSQFQVQKDDAKIGKYTFSITTAGINAILSALKSRTAITSGSYQVPTADDLAGITGQFTILNNPDKQPKLVTKDVTYYYGIGKVPTTADFISSVTNALGATGNTSDVTSNLSGIAFNSNTDGTYTVTLTYTDSLSGESVQASAQLHVISSTASTAESTTASTTASQTQSTTQSQTESTTQSQTESTTQSQTESTTQSQTESTTQSQTESATESTTQSQTESTTQSQTESTTESTTQSQTESTTQSQTESATESTTQSQTESTTQSQTESTTQSQTESTTQSQTESTTQSQTESATESTTQSQTESTTQSQTESTTQSQTESATESTTQSQTESTTQSQTESATESTTQSQTESATESTTQSQTESATESTTQSQTESTTQSQTESTTQSQTESTTQSQTESTTQSQTESTTQSQTESATESTTQSQTESTTQSQTESATESTTQSQTESTTQSQTESTTQSQ
ncbi:hypothetical protein, partial [Schleiferilactobacillus perolens]|uniref:hypothetical protein n=1 Tax=Schleiferilactobacillus perolens TaxID=100468 RepID=UPI0023554226